MIWNWILIAIASCAAPHPAVPLEGLYQTVGLTPFPAGGQTVYAIQLDFTSDGYWQQGGITQVDMRLRSNGTYTFDGSTLVLNSTLSWQQQRTAIAHHDTLSLNDPDFGPLTLVHQ